MYKQLGKQIFFYASEKIIKRIEINQWNILLKKSDAIKLKCVSCWMKYKHKSLYTANKCGTLAHKSMDPLPQLYNHLKYIFKLT